MDALWNVLWQLGFNRPNSIEILIGHIYTDSDTEPTIESVADLACLSFDTLYAMHEIERQRIRKVYGYARLSSDMKRAVGYRCECCGCKEDSLLPEPHQDLSPHHRMTRYGARRRLRLRFINRNFNDWNPINIQVLCMDCYKIVQAAKPVAYKVEATHASVDGQVDTQTKKKARPKKNKKETRKERIVRQRTEAGQQTFV